MHPKSLPLVALVLGACAGEPFESAPSPFSDAGGATDAPVRVVIPPSGDAAVSVPVGFAALASGGLAAFDRTTGDVLAQHALAGIPLDVAWDPLTSRALVVTLDPDSESSTLHAFAYHDGSLAPVASAEPVTGAGRVWVWRERLLLVTQEMSATWTLFDASLVADKLGKSLFLPAGLAEAPSGDALFGLDANHFDQGVDHDALAQVSYGATFELKFWPFPAPGRPGSRFASASEPDTLWLVRKHAAEPRYEIAAIDALAPAPPVEFRSVSVESAPGTLEAVVLEPQRETLIVTLSRDLFGGAGELVLLPIATDAAGVAYPLAGGVESSPFPARHLALDPVTGRVLVATSAGIGAYVMGGTAKAPTLAPDTTFAGGVLMAPFVLASP